MLEKLKKLKSITKIAIQKLKKLKRIIVENVVRTNKEVKYTKKEFKTWYKEVWKK